jgi:hypothetical protein
VVKTLLVDSLESLLQLQSEFNQQCKVRPSYLYGIIRLKQETGHVNKKHETGHVNKKQETGHVNTKQETGHVNTRQETGHVNKKTHYHIAVSVFC